MRNYLKSYRMDKLMDRKAAAKAAGVTLATYRKWENGETTIPEDKVAKLAKTFKTTPDELMARHPFRSAFRYTDKSRKKDRYHGEVAIHFVGGGKPLLLSISNENFSYFSSNVQDETPFATVETLSNETVFLRKAAIADFIVLSDDYGVEELLDTEYGECSPIHLPDSRDWEIIEQLENGVPLKSFDQQSVANVCGLLRLEDQIPDGFKPEEEIVALTTTPIMKYRFSECELECASFLECVFERAFTIRYQLSNGRKHVEHIYDDEEIFTAFHQLYDLDPILEEVVTNIVIPVEDCDRLIGINPHAVDYIMIPSHKYSNGLWEFWDPEN